MLESIELFQKYEIWTDVWIEDYFLNSKKSQFLPLYQQ